MTEKEAHEFFFGDGDKGTWAGIINNTSSLLPSVSEVQWTEMYARCGGNIGMLKRCVDKAEDEGNWDDALKHIVQRPRSDIVNAFTPAAMPHRDEPPLWTALQWERVLERITTAPHHAVLMNELMKVLGEGDDGQGKQILLSLVKYNLLALRPYSTLARDLPPEVFGDDRKKEVVTLQSAAHLWEAKEELLERKSDAEKAAADLAEKAKGRNKTVGLF